MFVMMLRPPATTKVKNIIRYMSGGLGQEDISKIIM
jgi:hypothetical protein